MAPQHDPNCIGGEKGPCNCGLDALRARVAELEAALEEIGCRTPHAGHPNRTDCPICAIVDRVIK